MDKELKRMRQQREDHAATLLALRDRKLMYRVFRALDEEGRGAITMYNVRSQLPDLTQADEQYLGERLFQVAPQTFLATVHARELVEADVQAALADAVSVPPEAVRVTARETGLGGSFSLEVSLRWSCPPEAMWFDRGEDAQLSREAYFGPFGGDASGVSEAQGRAKERELRPLIGSALGRLGVEVEQVSEVQCVGFDDFYCVLWQGSTEADLPEPLRDLVRAARLKEEETVLPEEAGDRIRELEHKIQKQRRQTEQKKKELAQIELESKAVDKQIDQTVRELRHIQGTTGYDRAKNIKTPDVDWEIQERQMEELTALVARVKEEKVKGEQILRKKCQLIGELSKELESLKEREENTYQMVNELRVADREIAELENQLQVLKEEHRRSDRAIVALEGQRDVAVIDSLQQDKEYLRQQIAKHIEKRREQDKIVSAQAARVQQLEQRVACVEQAVRDLSMWGRVQARLKDSMVPLGEEDDLLDPVDIDRIIPQNEKIDVELYELLNRELEAVSESRKLKDILLQEKQCTIEATGEKVDQLHASREDDERYYAEELERYRYDTWALQEQLDRQRVDHRRQEQTARREVNHARNRALESAKRRAQLAGTATPR
eukprot:TRINITY_DN69949_c0_g1_i1.p1 TRINITY_DN69949_c0_g1~~TRINITY_DN69949_c0_g1_i1.p1  ORF type:complete len:696 (+),score=310.57 TRINITY_DN69949_c0_g1_i1:262-2088(+)